MFKKRLNDHFFKVLPIIILLIIGYFTYVNNYDQPPVLFWDEPYYIPPAQKYLNGIFFMHDHPPLGKILIALGERIIHANPNNDQFISADYAKELPVNFSLAGYRFFPVIFAWVNIVLLFLILNILNQNIIISFLLSCLYLFDNALIVHFRGAMLDSILIFFMLSSLLLFLLLSRWKNDKYNQYNQYKFVYGSIGLGITLAFAVTTKSTGVIIILLFPILFVRFLPDWKKALLTLILSGLGFAIAYIVVWQLHFSLTFYINPELSNKGYYAASPAYQEILIKKQNTSLLSFPIMLRDSLKYAEHYHAGVPSLNLCKSGENGSPPIYWLVGARAINYRWETKQGTIYQYLYLQCNPVVWFIGLLGVILATILILADFLLSLAQPVKNKSLIITFLLLYYGYVIGVSLIPRVMYLYHYFPPLIFSFCLFALSFQEIRQLGIFRLAQNLKVFILTGIVVLSFISYRFYSPLTYYQPLTDSEVQQRAILPVWNLHCVKCTK